MRRGRFSKPLDRAMRELNSSLRWDVKMLAEDIEASQVHARRLFEMGILRDGELREVLEGLERVRQGIESGEFALDPDLEDIHMNVEALLGRFTEAAARLHTARSRNDQVVTDFRLWCKRRAQELCAKALDLAEVFAGRAAKYKRAPIPAYTHTQRAQVTTLGHYLLTYAFMFLRDHDRFAYAHRTAARCALGSGACAGVAYPYPRDEAARELGMYPPIESSLDAVSDRDFACDLLYACAMCAQHLSRLGEEWVLWSSAEFGFLTLDEGFSSGSSIMPQKRNPDAAEILRGLSAEVAGNLVGLITLVSGLPLGYSKDLQGDKALVMPSVESLTLALDVALGMVETATFNLKRMEEAAQDPSLYATDIADLLVSRGVAFRKAHEAVGEFMRKVASEGKQALEPKALLRAFPELREEDLSGLFDPIASIERRISEGGPSRGSLSRLLSKARRAISERRGALEKAGGRLR